MIERPKRSVTYFFVPLIDVLILLFCIFLLMPFVASLPTFRCSYNFGDEFRIRLDHVHD